MWYASTCLIIFCIICIVLIFSSYSFHILPQLTLPYLIFSYLILPYLTLSYLLWFHLTHFILFLSRFQPCLQMRIFLWIMTGYLLLIQPEENSENVSQLWSRSYYILFSIFPSLFFPLYLSMFISTFFLLLIFRYSLFSNLLFSS